MVPTVEFPPAMPLTFQVTAVFVVFVTVALNCWVPPRKTVAFGGETLTLIGGGGGGGGELFSPVTPQPAAEKMMRRNRGRLFLIVRPAA